MLIGSNRFTTFTTGQIIVLPFAIGAKNLAAALMKYSFWFPLYLGLAAVLTELAVICWVLPIDLLAKTKTYTLGGTQVDVQNHSKNFDEQVSKLSPLHQTVMLQTKQTFQVVFSSLSVLLLTSTFLATSVFGQLMAGSVFLQYVEKVLGIDLAEVRSSKLYCIEDKAKAFKASRLQANSDSMNMASLIVTFVIFGNLNSPVLGRLGSWLRTLFSMPRDRTQLVSAGSINISRFCAIVTTLGFLIIAIGQNYWTVIAGQLKYGQGSKIGLQETHTNYFRLVILCCWPSFSDVNPKHLDLHDRGWYR
jgi:hypothetical protein